MKNTFKTFLAATFSVLLAAGCATGKKEAVIHIPLSETDLLKKLSEKRAYLIESLKIYGKGEALVNNKRMKFKIAMLLKKPGFHHIEITTSFGKPVIIITGNTAVSYLTDFNTSKIFKSQPPEKLLSKVTGIDIVPEDFIDLLSWQNNPKMDATTTFKQLDDDFYNITETENDRETNYLVNNAKGFINKITFRDNKNAKTQSIIYSGEKISGAYVLPASISFINTEGIKSFQIDIDEADINPLIPEETFSLSNPLNLEIKNIP